MGKFLHCETFPTFKSCDFNLSPCCLHYTTLFFNVAQVKRWYRGYPRKRRYDRWHKWGKQIQNRRGPWHFEKSMPDLEWAAAPWRKPIVAAQNCGQCCQTRQRSRFLFTQKSLSLKMLTTNTNSLEILELAYWEDKESSNWTGILWCRNGRETLKGKGQLHENLDCHTQGAYQLSFTVWVITKGFKKKRDKIRKAF